MHNTDVNRATSMRMYFSNYSSKIPYHALLLYSMCTMTLIPLHVNMGGCGTVWAAALMFMDMICTLHWPHTVDFQISSGSELASFCLSFLFVF